MIKKLSALVLILAILLPSVLSCRPEEKKTSFTTNGFTYFNTVTTIVGYETTQEKFSAECNEIFALIGEYHMLFDIYNEYNGVNNLCTVNKLVDGVHQTVKVDRKIIDMLLKAKEMYTLTGGVMNVAMGSVLSIWHDYRTEGLETPKDAKLPPMELLEAAAEHTNIDDIIIDVENCTVFLADPEMSLDVGAFAKGYAVEMVAKMLEEKGKSNYVINIGGNIRTIGTRYDGSAWRTGIKDPVDTETYAQIIGLGGGDAIVTSGSYERYYTVVVSAKCSKCDWVYDQSLGIPEQEVAPGTMPSRLTSDNKCPLCDSRIRRTSKQFHHIIDPDTLMPSEGLLSVSIICKDSGMGDGLSTALFCMSIEDGMALINSLDNVEAFWVDANEVKYYSDGFSSYISN